MSRADTWMPLYVADYLRDTTHLSAEEHGGYLLLLMGCWTRGGLLPAEDAKLSAIARMAPAAWKRSRGTIMEFFTRDGDGWTHKRVAAELKRSQELSEKRRMAGAKGGEAKAQNAGNGLANAKQTVEQKPTHAGVAPPSPSPLPLEASSGADAPSVSISREAARAEAMAFASFWKLYPRKVAQPLAAKAYAKAIRRIGGPDPPSTILAGLHAHLPGWAETEPDLVPHPTTWLNQDRFNDRPAPRQPRLIHDRTGSHPDRRTAAFAERLSAYDDAADAAMR